MHCASFSIVAISIEVDGVSFVIEGISKVIDVAKIATSEAEVNLKTVSS
jgi:hypothetical protein